MTYLDSTDKKMLRLLQKDFRTSVAKISRELELTHNATKYRMDRLMKSGVIKQYPDFLNPRELGKKLKVTFLMQVDSSEIKKTIAMLSGFSELTHVYRTLGLYSIVAIGIFASRGELSRFMDAKLYAQTPAIKQCIEQIVIKSVKEARFAI